MITVTKKILDSIKNLDTNSLAFHDLLSEFLMSDGLSLEEIIYLYIKSLMTDKSNISKQWFMSTGQKADLGACLFIEKLKQDTQHPHYFALLSSCNQDTEKLCSLFKEYSLKGAEELFRNYTGMMPYDTGTIQDKLQDAFTSQEQNHDEMETDAVSTCVFFWSPV